MNGNFHDMKVKWEGNNSCGKAVVSDMQCDHFPDLNLEGKKGLMVHYGACAILHV